ncbi:MAG: oxidoreductase [Sulfurospirillum sp.]|nr:MAG: oxidoreductase [Sulfurospirillum sp.]
MKYDVCIIGSGAGAGPVAYELSRAGKKVVVLEKGSFYKEENFSKDEIAFCRRSIVTPKLKDEYHLIEDKVDGKWQATPTWKSGWDFWNGNIVGGSSNFMSGLFHRLHPDDFRLKSRFGEIDGANITDWPISYEEMEPYYEKVERVVGVSGKVVPHRYQQPRSTKDFPYPATEEQPVSKLIDQTCKAMQIDVIKTPRAIMSVPKEDRSACYYSNYCGSYGCSSGAKGSARAALLQPALKTGNLTIKTGHHVKQLEVDAKGRVRAAKCVHEGKETEIEADLFVVAAQAIETSRLLLNSRSKQFPDGLANNSGQVGKNMLFSAGGVVSGDLDEKVLSPKALFAEGLFVNRTIKAWYFLDEKTKGGISEALWEHANPILRANRSKWSDGGILWGEKLQDKLLERFTKKRNLQFEIFNDWLPNDDCFVTVDEKYRDKYGMPVAKLRIGSHPQNEKIGNILAQKTVKVLEKIGATNIQISIGPYPPQNLQAGGCRFGNDPKTSVLDKNCRAHEVPNLYITDGSFMPTGGSVPYTWTIYANAFRVADVILTV